MRFTMLAAIATIIIPAEAYAQRTERIRPATVLVTPTCPMTNDNAIARERDTFVVESALGVALGGVVASFVGDLAGAGINMLGQALDRASQERGYVAEGLRGYYFHQLRPNPADPGGAALAQPRQCLVLFLPSATGTLSEVGADPEILALNRRMVRSGHPLRVIAADDSDRSRDLVEQALEPLVDAGLTTLPSVYIEAEILPAREGMVIRPVLVWYREAIRGAPSGETATEFHVSFGTPASGANATDIGAVFAVARVPLPRMRPGGPILGSTDLAGYRSVYVPTRPTAGNVDAMLADANGVFTARATRQAELDAAQRALDAAARQQAASNTPAHREAVTVATEVRDRAQTALQRAEAAVQRVRSAGNVNTGSTNVKARFVAVRDANLFVQAIARALTARSEAVDTAVTNALTPTPAWTAADTTYLQAMTNVAAKQRELDAAHTAGDAATIVRLTDELTILKARANEAAVTLQRPIPFPGLI